MNKKILLISRQAPYGKSAAREAIDAALAASIYDQDIGILFMDDGVFQLLKNQQSQLIDQKNIGSILPALALYGIENVYVHQESLDARAIKLDEIIFDDPQLLNNKDVGNLLNEQDQLLSF
ncbi:MAG TPA: sulfurtransferase complex subunit TusC [Cellvibrio sp.]|uniref:sulfurtransferase complex subunit TusC n=1 Tax=Cellvibrio sp. TaxID=1965322 RepID=UPI000EEC02BD|nr:sulfurtransferase complex subunit TusC [Cellvibrio sp.]HCS63449.1 sulfurtransferase complex subunit TusC [Cellvibrio sp.]